MGAAVSGGNGESFLCYSVHGGTGAWAPGTMFTLGGKLLKSVIAGVVVLTPLILSKP